jgi:hypothetical protein
MLRLTPSIHLSLGLPLLHVPSGSHSNIFSGSLFPGILFTCRNHHSCFSSINSKMFFPTSMISLNIYLFIFIYKSSSLFVELRDDYFCSCSSGCHFHLLNPAMGKLVSTSAFPALQILRGLREVLSASSKQFQSTYAKCDSFPYWLNKLNVIKHFKHCSPAKIKILISEYLYFYIVSCCFRLETITCTVLQFKENSLEAFNYY